MDEGHNRSKAVSALPFFHEQKSVEGVRVSLQMRKIIQSIIQRVFIFFEDVSARMKIISLCGLACYNFLWSCSCSFDCRKWSYCKYTDFFDRAFYFTICVFLTTICGTWKKTLFFLAERKCNGLISIRSTSPTVSHRNK